MLLTSNRIPFKFVLFCYNNSLCFYYLLTTSTASTNVYNVFLKKSNDIKKNKKKLYKCRKHFVNWKQQKTIEDEFYGRIVLKLR